MNTTEIILLTIVVILIITCIIVNTKLHQSTTLCDNLAEDVVKAEREKYKLTKENKLLIERQTSMQKAFVTAEKDLKHKITFNLPDTGDLAINVKVKTQVNAKTGISTLYPTIRRKVDGTWKEIPIDIKYNI